MPSGDGANEALRNLRVLAEIERDSQISQRTIAQRVGMAVGLTNSVLRRLVRKGLVTTRALPANRLAYHLTPKGIADKTRLFVDYVRTTTNFFCILRNGVNDRLRRIQAERPVKTVAVVGLNELSEVVFLATREVGLDLVAVYDAAKAGATWLGYAVAPLGETVDGDVIIVMDLDGVEPRRWRAVRPESVVVEITDILAADLITLARGFQMERAGDETA